MLHLWEISSGRDLLLPAEAHARRVSAAVVKHDREALVTASADGTVRIWSMATGRQLRVLLDEPSALFDLPATIVLSRDDRSLVAAMGDGSVVHAWDIVQGNSTAFPSGSGRMRALAYTDQDRSILALSEDGILRRWSSKDRRIEVEISLESLLERVEPDHPMKEMLTAATFFAGGRMLALTASGSVLHVVDVASGKATGHVREAKLVAVSADERTLAVTRNGMHDTSRRVDNDRQRDFVKTSATIVLVGAGTSREIHRMEVAASDVWSLAFSPDSKTLAATTGWETGQIHLYEVATGKEFRTIETPAIRTPALTFTPDGSQLICGMADTSVPVWDLQPQL